MNECHFHCWLFFFDIVQEESKSRTLILIAGFIHDLSSFLDHHPGGRNHLNQGSGKEMTASFFGGVYAHSNAAHNVSCGLPTRDPQQIWFAGFFLASLHDANRRVRWRRGSSVPSWSFHTHPTIVYLRKTGSMTWHPFNNPSPRQKEVTYDSYTYNVTLLCKI